MSDMRLLVTGVGSTTAQSVIKGIHRQSEYDVRVVGTDINDARDIAGSRFCDEFYRVPPATNTTAYVDRLSEIVRSEQIDLLVPIVDAELPVVTAHREELSGECTVLVSDPDTVDICNDKYRTYEWMTDHGYQTPETVLDPTRDELGELFDGESKLIAKPRRGVSSRGVYELRDPEEQFLLDRIEDPVVQLKVSGTEYTVDVYHDEEGTTVVPRERVDTRAGISYVGEVTTDERISSLVTDLVSDLGIRGPANVQCFDDGEEISLFEVNPRFSGSLPLTIEAGLNSPLLALQCAAGDERTHPEQIEEVRMHRFWNEVFRREDRSRIYESPEP